MATDPPRPREGTARRRPRAPLIAGPVLVSVACMVIWGASPVATRIATEDMEPLVIVVLRTVLAAVVAVPLVSVSRLRPPTNGVSRALLAVSALVAFVIFPIIYTYGQERTSAMHGVAILAGLPVFTGLWAALVTRRLPGAWWLCGCAIALGGEAVIIAVRGGGEHGAATLGGDLLVLAGALAVSSGYVAGALLVPRGVSSATTTYWGVILGAIVLAPLGIALFAGGHVPHADARSWAAVLFLAVMVSIVGYVGWYWALDRGGIMRMAPLMFLQPISGLLLAGLLLDERLTWALAVGAVFVLGGVWVARRE
ncbi:MAG TPA: DMT family transporter [Gaiella sp.]|nr:DMT family transporter [Gaiella sp.]